MIAVRLPAAMASRTSGQVRSSIQTVGTWPYAGSPTRSSATSKNNRFMKASWVPSVYEVALHRAKRLPLLSSGDLNLALPARGAQGRNCSWIGGAPQEFGRDRNNWTPHAWPRLFLVRYDRPDEHWGTACCYDRSGSCFAPCFSRRPPARRH